MDHPLLHAERRTAIGKTVDHLRRQRRIPAVVYGHGLSSRPLEIDQSEFIRIYKMAGATSLVDLTVGQDKPVKVLIHSIQRHPTRQTVNHVDLYQVKMTERIEAEIGLTFDGESPAIKEQGGILVRALDKLKVSCLPGDLVSSISVDIGALKTFEDRIHVKDLKLSDAITVMISGDEVVASVIPPRSEAELEALSGEVKEDVAAVEVEKKGKEEEEAAEGVLPDEAEPAKPSKDKE